MKLQSIEFAQIHSCCKAPFLKKTAIVNYEDWLKRIMWFFFSEKKGNVMF